MCRKRGAGGGAFHEGRARLCQVVGAPKPGQRVPAAGEAEGRNGMGRVHVRKHLLSGKHRVGSPRTGPGYILIFNKTERGDAGM